ncbi:MAG: SO_0444 family Cu/Zn efflux transporter [Planctomycetota bacterium]
MIDRLLDALGDFAAAFAQLTLESAPFLLLGLIMAGIIGVLLPKKTLTSILGTGRWTSIIRAAVVGVPLPLCSCSVLPAAVSLHRSGARRGATTGFLVSTPENGVDSIALSYALMGLPFTALRVVTATLTAIATGFLVELAGSERKQSNSLTVKPCCASNQNDSCCTSEDHTHEPAKNGSVIERSIRYAFGEVLTEIGGWLAIGLLVAAAILAFVPSDFIETYGQGPLGMLVVLAIAVPMYICAAGSTPMAAALLASGMSPGTVLVFLLAGPATNIASFGVLKQELGARSAALVMLSVGATSIAAGLIVDALLPTSWFAIADDVGAHADFIPDFVRVFSAAVLGIALMAPAIRRMTKRMFPSRDHGRALEGA